MFNSVPAKLDNFLIYCPACDCYFKSDSQYYYHRTLTLESDRYKAEIKSICAKLNSIGYKVDDKMRVMAKKEESENVRLKSLNQSTRKSSTKRTKMAYFNEESTVKALKEERKRAEKLKRQFNAFSIKPKYYIKPQTKVEYQS